MKQHDVTCPCFSNGNVCTCGSGGPIHTGSSTEVYEKRIQELEIELKRARATSTEGNYSTYRNGYLARNVLKQYQNVIKQ